MSSRQSTPKRVSFRKFIETSKAKTSNYIPFKKYIQNYKQKKKANCYSPIEGKMQISSKIRMSMPGGTSGNIVLKVCFWIRLKLDFCVPSHTHTSFNALFCTFNCHLLCWSCRSPLPPGKIILTQRME